MITPYSENFIEECFIFWYTNGRPSGYKMIEMEECPKDSYKRIPTRAIIELWISERGWRERADALDAQAETKINDELVALKVAMLRKQAAQAAAVRQRAFDYLMENNFDSSASAVSAFLKSGEMERITIGISKTIEKLSQMDNDEVLQTVKELAARAGETTIDAAEIPEETEETEETEGEIAEFSD